MGKISQGIIGGISGKVGNVIGASWKGIHYLRIKPASVANPRTEGQVNQRNKFSAALEFLQPSLAFIKVGYKFHQNKQSAFNAAMSYILHNAITGSAPDFTVNYATALVSRGNLTGVLEPTVSIAEGEATISWTNNGSDGNARPDDTAMLLVYFPGSKESVVRVMTTDTRLSGTMTVDLSSFPGETAQIYLAFRSADGSAVSDSSYVGSETVV